MGEIKYCPLKPSRIPCTKTCEWHLKEYDKCAVIILAENAIKSQEANTYVMFTKSEQAD